MKYEMLEQKVFHHFPMNDGCWSEKIYKSIYNL